MSESDGIKEGDKLERRMAGLKEFHSEGVTGHFLVSPSVPWTVFDSGMCWV